MRKTTTYGSNRLRSESVKNYLTFLFLTVRFSRIKFCRKIHRERNWNVRIHEPKNGYFQKKNKKMTRLDRLRWRVRAHVEIGNNEIRPLTIQIRNRAIRCAMFSVPLSESVGIKYHFALNETSGRSSTRYRRWRFENGLCRFLFRTIRRLACENVIVVIRSSKENNWFSFFDFWFLIGMFVQNGKTIDNNESDERRIFFRPFSKAFRPFQTGIPVPRKSTFSPAPFAPV